MRRQSQAGWHRSSRPELKDWLKRDRSDLDLMRLRAIGNIVFPKTAQLGMHVLAWQHGSHN